VLQLFGSTLGGARRRSADSPTGRVMAEGPNNGTAPCLFGKNPQTYGHDSGSRLTALPER